jgi:hypothetical protein
MKEISRIVQDQQMYIESIGKQDREAVRGALADKGDDTVLRLCLGVSSEPMPLRSLGYFASAIALQERYFPDAELQFVYPVSAAHTINNVDIEVARRNALATDTVASRHFARSFGQGTVASFFDTEMPSLDLQAAVADVLGQQPGLANAFRASAKGRDADYVPYVAAHVLMHDTNPQLASVGRGRPAKSQAGRVISIGAQSERPFYLARMACRQARVLPDDAQVVTGQLFTRHVIPPYVSCREGEPTMDGIEIMQDQEISHPVASVQRDLAYLRSALLGEQARTGELA